jgi:ABC-type methionine transport system ATPase subunit
VIAGRSAVRDGTHIRARGTALVIVEQRPELVAEMCREIVTIDNGRVTARQRLGTNRRLPIISSDRPAL